MDKNDTIILGHAMIRGLFEAEFKLGWRPWTLIGLPSFFEEYPANIQAGGTGFSALLTPISAAEFRQWRRDFLMKGDGDELVEVILISAYCHDDGPLETIRRRFESGPQMETAAVIACLFYFVLMGAPVDSRSVIAILESKTHWQKSSCQALVLSYWEAFPESIGDEDLWNALSTVKDPRLLRDHVALIDRLLRKGHDMQDLIITLAKWHDSGRLFFQRITQIILENQDRILAEEFLSLGSASLAPFATTLLELGGYEFMEDLVVARLDKVSTGEEFCYLLPLLAAIRPENGSWLETFASSSSWYSRRGAAYALVWYQDYGALLESLAHDEVDDVSMAARFSLAALAHGRSGSDDASWCLAVADMLRPSWIVPLYLVPAICASRRFSETLLLRDWRLLDSDSGDKQVEQFYFEHSGLLVESIMRVDEENEWQLDKGMEDDHDFPGRALLLLVMCDVPAARLILDQLLQDSRLQGSAIWLHFLLDACGGPLSPLAALKGRIVAHINEPDGFVLGADDIGLFPVLMNDDFCLECIVKANAERIVSAYPYSVGRWVRSEVAPEVRALLVAASGQLTMDPFLLGLDEFAKEDAIPDLLTLPERYFYLDLGDLNTRKSTLFTAVALSDCSNEARIESLLALARVASRDIFQSPPAFISSEL